MPDHRVHRFIDRAVLGREYPWVHRFMDKPYRLLGPRHRILFHDAGTVVLLMAVDPGAGLSALLHIVADHALPSRRAGRRRHVMRRWVRRRG